ncbi:tyrosyl-DNA phosphodiesterase-domain-containing protein [Mycena amicta]|nr:tyrosyl-DNA phosphodiesterase-domain-containing protein [Mycena amicta]
MEGQNRSRAPPAPKSVPADDSVTEDETDEEPDLKPMESKHWQKKSSDGKATATDSNDSKPPRTRHSASDTKKSTSKSPNAAAATSKSKPAKSAIIINDSDSESNSELIPSPKVRPAAKSSSAKGKGKANDVEKEKEEVKTLSAPSGTSLKSIPDRAQLEAERLARQKKRTLDLEASGGNSASERETKRPRTSISSSSAPMSSRRFDTGIVIPTFTTYANPRADGRESITFQDVLGIDKTPDTTLELAMLASFGADYTWLAPHFPANVPVIVVAATGSEERGPTTSRPFPNENWVQTSPQMKQHICMHMKYIILLYKSGRLRVVVSTANLLGLDWSGLENAVFIQDVYLRSDSSPGRLGDGSTPNSKGHSTSFNTEDGFANILESVLEATNIEPALQAVRQKNPRLRLTAISDISELWDWRGVRAELVASIPGKHQGWKAIRRTGHPRLMCAVDALGLRVNSGSSSKTPVLSLECGGSSIPAYTTQWVTQFYVSASGDRASLREHLNLSENKRKQAPYPPGVKVIFPTRKGVLQAGGHGAGSLFCTRKKWEAKNFPRSAFYQSQSRAGSTLMHTKMIIASFSDKQRRTSGASDAAGWMYVGSHNFTQHAWGNLTGNEDSPVLNVNNYELGVVLPLQTPPELDKMSAWERPPRKYGSDDVPWFLDEAATLMSQGMGLD